jgi:hypothetical protein
VKLRGGLNTRSYGAAEKDDEGMALEILTRVEDMPDGIDNLESHIHTKWKRTTNFNWFDHDLGKG